MDTGGTDRRRGKHQRSRYRIAAHWRSITNLERVFKPPRRQDRQALRIIISGGQTGVDRAALDAALSVGIATGGWCPRGRRAEDGKIDERYPLRETPSRVYSQRTEWNVRDSDATLILCRGAMTGGTQLTADIAVRHKRPLQVLDLDSAPDAAIAGEWLREHRVGVLNVAGPREEGFPGIYSQALAFLLRLLT